ncbi:MAG TPA: PAS domain S-box protein, partial [bacterium]|nr:PAS domain S-box protein [bacterium]
MFGLQNQEQMVGRRVADFLVPRHKDYVDDLNVRRQKGEDVPSQYQVLCTHADGSVFEVEVSASTFRYKERLASIALLRDISVRLKAEQALRESEERFRTFVEHAAEGICVIQDAVIKYLNPHACELIDCLPEEAIGMPFDHFVEPADKQKVGLSYQKHLSGDESYQVLQMNVLRKDGQRVEVEISLGPVTFDGRPGTLIFVRDLTERKRLEETIRQAQKTQALAVLAAGISHNFNNLLYIIRGNTEMLAHELDPANKKASEYLSEILTAVERASDMVSQIVTFGRQTEQQFMPFLIQPILKESLRLIRNSKPPGVVLHQDIAPNCPPILGD